jgi:transcriptional regulator with XRE-family HTH domain
MQECLKDLRVEKGMTLESLSQQPKIPASTLGSYESDDYKEIPHRNIIELAKFYEVSTDYLLGLTENRQLDNVALSALHLSDTALTLLEDKKINMLLLSELITHEQFRKFMLDLEIYVDGLDSAPPKTITEHWEEILEKAENFAGTSKQKLAYIFSQFLKIKPTEKNIDDMADMLGQSEILESDAKKCRNSVKRKQSKD